MNDSSAQSDAGNRRQPTVVALTGFMGCGKSAVGRNLAELLGWSFVDLDEEIERREGLAIREIFARRGETAFREVEHQALTELLATGRTNVVLALGGGTYAQARNEALLRHASVWTIFIDVPLATLLRRCCSAQDPEQSRPLAADAEKFKQLYEARMPSYRQAEMIFEADERPAMENARAIAAKLALIRENDAGA